VTYPAAQFRQEIVRRLGGRCRINLLVGKALTFGGDRLDNYTSCAECREECGAINATGGVEFGGISFEIDGRGAITKLRWACPSCDNPVTEETTAMEALAAAEAISADPLCASCRFLRPIG